MNKNSCISQLTLTTISLACVCSAIAIQPVQAANIKEWKIDFFNDAGEFAGEGSFSYDLDTETFVETFFYEDSEPEGFYVQAALESFSAEILGETWSLGDQPGNVTWWADSTGQQGQQVFHRSPEPFINSGYWFFGDQFFGTEQFVISSMEMISETVWEGSWFQFVLDSTGPGPGTSGTWTATLETLATPVPEPTTLLGLIAVFGFGVLFPQKRR
ncbi:MAG: PEP-CTERM sorting domain-containing protein [Lyngbya sp.]|nr:PEP-CTERM sorting domain-containing protein [Lyngbya sp.]